MREVLIKAIPFDDLKMTELEVSLGLSCHIGPDGLGIACCNKAE